MTLGLFGYRIRVARSTRSPALGTRVPWAAWLRAAGALGVALATLLPATTPALGQSATKLAFLTTQFTALAGGSNPTVVVVLQDGAGHQVANPTALYVSLASSIATDTLFVTDGRVVTGSGALLCVTIPANDPFGVQFGITATGAETPTITAAAFTQNTCTTPAGLTSVAQTETFVTSQPGTATQLAFRTVPFIAETSVIFPGPIIVAAEDSTGQERGLDGSNLYVNITSSSSVATFYEDQQGFTVVPACFFRSSASETLFWYKDANIGAPTITVAAFTDNLCTASILTVVTQTETIPDPCVTGSSGSGGVTVCFNVEAAVTSVTVSPATAVAFGGCKDASNGDANGLVAPNGTCNTNAHPITITVTNSGTTTVNVQVKGSPAIPSSGSNQSWNLCQGTGAVPCSGPGTPAGKPGRDEFNVQLTSASAGGPVIELKADTGTSPSIVSGYQCDTIVDTSANCAGIAAGTPTKSVSEVATIVGPQSSTNLSTSFTTTWTWLVG